MSKLSKGLLSTIVGSLFLSGCGLILDKNAITISPEPGERLIDYVIRTTDEIRLRSMETPKKEFGRVEDFYSYAKDLRYLPKIDTYELSIAFPIPAEIIFDESAAVEQFCEWRNGTLYTPNHGVVPFFWNARSVQAICVDKETDARLFIFHRMNTSSPIYWHAYFEKYVTGSDVHPSHKGKYDITNVSYSVIEADSVEGAQHPLFMAANGRGNPYIARNSKIPLANLSPEMTGLVVFRMREGAEILETTNPRIHPSEIKGGYRPKNKK